MTNVSANDIREAAKRARELGQAIRARSLEDYANEIDPKPQVFVRAAYATAYAINREGGEVYRVIFENTDDSKAVSHFLHVAEHLIEDLYLNDTRKQDVIRAFVKGWYTRND